MTASHLDMSRPSSAYAGPTKVGFPAPPEQENPVTDTDNVTTPEPDGYETAPEPPATEVPRIIYPTKTMLGDNGSVLVDATIAEAWLGANTHNRKLSNVRVDQMVRNMKAGQWDDNGETVKFSKTGVLLDGQHRLSAIIESDTVQVLTVVAGLDDKVQRSIDIGGKRTVGQQLDLNGHHDGKALASIARFAMQMASYPRVFRPSEMEVTEVAISDEKLQWVVAKVIPTLPAILGSPTVRGYVYRVLHEVDPDACATFFSKLTTLEKLPQDSPILALYRRLATPDMRKDGLRGRVAMVTCYFIAWNAWRNGEPRQIIKPHSNAEGYIMPPKPI